MAYLNEVTVDQVYNVNIYADGWLEYKVKDIRATNVIGVDDYIIAVGFEGPNGYFQTNIEEVIDGTNYKLIFK